MRRVVAGEEPALIELLALVEPDVGRIARRLRILRSKGRTEPDDLAQVRAHVFGRLARARTKSLARFVTTLGTRGQTQTFSGWLAGCVRRAAMDYLRQYDGRRPRVSSQVNGAFQPSIDDVNRPSVDPDLDFERLHRSYVGVTKQLTIAELRTFIETQFTPTEVAALNMHFDDHSFVEIAAKLELPSEDEALKLVRRLKERLRQRFRAQLPPYHGDA